MTAPLVLYDDAVARAAEPLTLTRPFSELRAGALLVRERWERALGRRATGFRSAPQLAPFVEFDSPPQATGSLAAGTVVANARFAPSIEAKLSKLRPGDALVCGGRVAAIVLAKPLRAALLADGTFSLESLAGARTREVGGWWMDAAWDVIRHLPEMMVADARVLAGSFPDEPPAHVSVLGEHRFAVARGAYIEPHVVVDTTEGDIVVLPGARIGAFTRLAGPSVIGAHTQVAGGRFRCVSVGDHSRICGEMSVAIVAGHANKAHDGFVGHSVIGRWANLGAGTTTSNLKNSYGSVRVEDSHGGHETGMQFLGSLIGDHVKTAIGTQLMTGTIVGAGANVFGDQSPDKFVPPFAWGDRAPFARFDVDRFLDVAARVMKRRDVAMTAGLRRTLRAAWEASVPHAESHARRTALRARPGPGRSR